MSKQIFFASLRLCVQTILVVYLLMISFTAHAQKNVRFDPDGSFWIIGDHGDGFSDFGGINLNAKRLRRLPSSGVQLNDGKTFRFKALSVKRDIHQLLAPERDERIDSRRAACRHVRRDENGRDEPNGDQRVRNRIDRIDPE